MISVDRLEAVVRVETAREKRLLTFSFLLASGFLTAVLFHFVQGVLLGRPWPYNTYLFNPVDRFNDLLHSIDSAATLDPYFRGPEGSVSTYFPFAYILLLALAPLTPELRIAVFLASAIGAMAVLMAWWSTGAAQTPSARRVSLMAGLVFLGSLYPFHFALDRGNLDAWIAPMCLGFVLAIRNGNRWLAVCLIAAATAMKGFPAVFLLLLVLERRYLPILMTLVLTVGLTVASSMALAGGLSRTIAGVQHGMSTFHAEYVIKNGSLHYSTDFFNLLKLGSKAGSLLGWWPYDPAAMVRPYHLAMFAVAAVVVFFVLFAPTELWRRVYAVCLLVLVVPDVANDYKLLMLLPAVLCLIDEAGEASQARRVLVLTALLVIPKHYVFLIHDISISCVVNPVLVLLLLWHVLADLPAWRAAFALAPARLRWYLHLAPAPALVDGARA